MSSQVFLGPTPIIEKSSSPPLRLATALLETAAGIGGTLEASAASRFTAPSTRHRAGDIGLILQILRAYPQRGKVRSVPATAQTLQSRNESINPCRTQ